MAYRETLRSRVLEGHGPTLAPAPGQISPNLSRTPTTRTYVPSGRRLASGGVARRTGGRRNDRRSNIGVSERGKASLVPALERISIRASAPRDSVTGQTGGREIDRESNVGVPECGEAERGEASLVPALERTSTTRASASRDSITGQTGGRGSGTGSNVGGAESGEAERGEAVGGSVLNRFEGPGYVDGGRGGRQGRRGRRGRGRWRGGEGGWIGGGGGGGGGGSWRRGGEGSTGGSQTLVSGRGRGSNEGQEARVARMEWDLTRWAKETPTIFLCKNPLRNSPQFSPWPLSTNEIN